MKIKAFNPQIIPKDAELILQLFQELGFARQDNPKGTGEPDSEGIRMKDENGFYMDILTDIKLPHDAVVIHMVVDDFDEACQLLQKHGFRNFHGDGKAETKSSKSALMILPSGFAINLMQDVSK